MSAAIPNAPVQLPGVALYVVDLSYDDQTALTAMMEPHMTWLVDAFVRGVFLASGRKQPWTGGILIARGERAVVEATVAASPWVVAGLAEASIVEVKLGLAVPPLADLLA